MSSGGQPAVMYDMTTCCSSGQYLVNPMYSLVFSGTCGEGGLFQEGIGGRSAADFALAARGKYSGSGGGFSGFGGL